MRRSINRNGPLFFVLLLALSLPLMVPRSAEAATWRGQTLANVNLRTAPNLEGAVVTGVTKGRLVTVSGQQNGWFYVSFHEGALEYHGWLYGRYVSAAKTAAPATGSAFVGLLSNASPAPTPAAPAVPPMTTTATPPSPAKSATVTRAAPATPPPATAPSAASVPAPAAKATPSPAPAATATAMVSVAKPVRSPKIVVSTPPPPATGTDLLKMPAPSSGTVGTADLIHLALRLTMILISGMALFLAYRELRRLSERA